MKYGVKLEMCFRRNSFFHQYILTFCFDCGSFVELDTQVLMRLGTDFESRPIYILVIGVFSCAQCSRLQFNMNIKLIMLNTSKKRIDSENIYM